MNDETLTMVERELLSWPGVSKEASEGGRSQDGFRVPPATVYRFGRRHIGHIHDTGVADITFPREIHDALISDGRAKPHPAGFKAVVSYPIRGPEDVPGAVELFRMSYERAKSAAERRQRTSTSSLNKLKATAEGWSVLTSLHRGRAERRQRRRAGDR